MIFAIYPKVAVKLGDERYVFDRSSLMFKDVLALEDASGYSYGEWEAELRRYSIRAVAALLHMLRKREGVPSDFETMNFAAEELDCIPLHDDGTEYTAAEVAEDILRRAKESQDPTLAAAGGNGKVTTASMSPTSPGYTESGPGRLRNSPGASGKDSKPKRTKT